MNTITDSTPASASTSCKTLVDTIVGVGTSWAAFGLKVGRTALVTSAETLGKTAETLDTLAAAIQKKAAAVASEGAPEADKAEGAGAAPAAKEKNDVSAPQAPAAAL